MAPAIVGTGIDKHTLDRELYKIVEPFSSLASDANATDQLSSAGTDAPGLVQYTACDAQSHVHADQFGHNQRTNLVVEIGHSILPLRDLVCRK